MDDVEEKSFGKQENTTMQVLLGMQGNVLLW